MRTSKMTIEIIRSHKIDKGYGETGESEQSTTYYATSERIWSKRNDSLRVAGAPILTYRLKIRSSALYDIASDNDSMNVLKYARVHGLKYSVVNIEQVPNSLSVVVELGGIMP